MDNITFTKAGEKMWQCPHCPQVIFFPSWKSLDINGFIKGTVLRPEKVFQENISGHERSHL